MGEQCKTAEVFVKINEEDLALVEIFNALGNEIRLEIVKMLLENQGLFCSDIVNKLHLSQPAISHHLKELRRSRVIVYKKEGSLVFYEVNKDYLKSVLGKFMEMLDTP
jgi:DNA-binding transcriptional ArsR family regulator